MHGPKQLTDKGGLGRAYGASVDISIFGNTLYKAGVLTGSAINIYMYI